MTNTNFTFKGGGLYGFIVTVILLIVLFYVAKGIFWVLTWLSPVLLIATLVLDYSVVTNYLKMLWGMITRTPIWGILVSVISFFAFPVVIMFLFGRAWFGYYVRKKTKEYKTQDTQMGSENEEFVAYEEIKSELFEPFDDVELNTKSKQYNEPKNR
jgi:hypothetical protein